MSTGRQREQPLELLLDWAKQGLKHRDKVGLISAAVSDHTQIDELAIRLRALGAKLSVSSMRVDPISVPLVRALRESGAQTLTIAPEAGSQRLRDVINKTQTEQQILEAVNLADSLDFPQLKLYFMIGHPGETDDDIQALVDLTLATKSRFRRRLVINATPYVPKAHTPFQWEAMTDVATFERRQKLIQRSLGRHDVAVRADLPQWAAVQAVLARGDRRLAPVLLDMERLSIAAFDRALAAHGLSQQDFLAAREPGSPQPWDIVESGVSSSFFLFEQRHAQRAETGLSCPPTSSGCLTCGSCDTDWAYRDNAGVPVKSKGPWRAQDWRPAPMPIPLLVDKDKYTRKQVDKDRAALPHSPVFLVPSFPSIPCLLACLHTCLPPISHERRHPPPPPLPQPGRLSRPGACGQHAAGRGEQRTVCQPEPEHQHR